MTINNQSLAELNRPTWNFLHPGCAPSAVSDRPCAFLAPPIRRKRGGLCSKASALKGFPSGREAAPLLVQQWLQCQNKLTRQPYAEGNQFLCDLRHCCHRSGFRGNWLEVSDLTLCGASRALRGPDMALTRIQSPSLLLVFS